MSQTCQRCYKIVARACQSDAEWADCPNLLRKRSALQHLEAKVRAQGSVARALPGYCWAEVRVYTGSKFPAFAQCSKHPRLSYLTCRWHADREEAAQALKRSTTVVEG